MKNISILVPERAVLASIDDPRHIFTLVNSFFAAAGKPPAFKVQLVGLTKDVKLHNSSFTVHTDLLIKEVKKTDMIFIPALAGDIEAAMEINKEMIPWIIQQYKGGAEVISLCSGAFFLANTGLLNGKKCSTHWIHANHFRERFPGVNLVEGEIITEEDGVYTSGGATSYWNLLLYLIEKYTDRQTAIHAAKVFAIDIDRTTQSPFIMFKGQTKHDDDSVKKAQEFIENNFQDRITIGQLCAMFAIGRRSLERRFKKATSNTVVEYIQRVKIEAAKKNFETSRKNINEIMYDVGYSDTKAFRTTFKKVTGLSPIEYRNRYNKSTVVYN
jgi:transcriptional regulator GlxA family with amidase domain